MNLGPWSRAASIGAVPYEDWDVLER
jgi:hypothetical protein